MTGDRAANGVDPKESGADHAELVIGHPEILFEGGEHREDRLAVRVVEQVGEPHEPEQDGGPSQRGVGKIGVGRHTQGSGGKHVFGGNLLGDDGHAVTLLGEARGAHGDEDAG